ncbi:MAG TPA: hypothetical protein VF406_11430 [Thermodesulfobacteriota bacterium]
MTLLVTTRGPSLLVGRLAGDFVRVRLPGPPHAAPGGDGRSRVRGEVDITAGPFRASYEATFAVEAFARLRDGLRALETAPGGVAALDALDPALVLEVRANGQGAFVAQGSAHPNPARAHRLTFSIDLDPGDLRQMLRGLDRLLEGGRAARP